MKGRQENEKKIEKRVEQLLKKSPRYLKGFYYSMSYKSYTTRYVYLRYVLDFVSFVSKEYGININDPKSFKKLKTSNINYYIAQLEGSNSIKASRLYGIKSFFNYLIDDEYIENNPCARSTAPRDNEEHKIISLNKDEIETIKNNILTNCDNPDSTGANAKWIKRDYAIVMLGLSLGLRVASLTEIDMDDINFNNNEIKIVEKGNKIRTVKFSDNISKILQEWIVIRNLIVKQSNKSCSALFISNQIKRINVRTIEHLIKKYTYNIDKHITPHKLRSTCATNVYNATGDIYLTANVLGHSNIANTRRYADISEERKQKAATAMDKILF